MPSLPDVGPGQYLIDAFHALRFARQGLEGMTPQTWVEIDAFARATRLISAGWEAQALFDMSWAYVTENQKAGDPLRIAPMERPNG
jgi:hypothetical protein